ncbi:prepilin-type N-terminal cleavage/methylation domain-containing protein [Microbacterium sp. CFBP9034]|uniref:prepilin-type N-terminal cleavage/methylation domain-containing protein n=1 Tax=Microbacterium sp. CFBP9034 TaxID=3096540 RepID=UPI002A69F202|nr:prepilin-type N-terminal cleavage/methylation domain-containing protein [Microbacterium sp. CFBP9034]MDY0910042.1 prepilin-type N-terminal cleavage/methylation domain-containing protein [Microbacterium sp. CFBP9034]
MSIQRSNANEDDDGFSLIEVIVVVVVLAILGSLIAMILVSTLRTQENVSAQTTATTRGQLVASEIERAMRNAVAFAITDGGATLKVNTSLDDELKCQGFTFGSNGVRMAVTGFPGPDSSVWPVWQDHIAQSGATDFFEETGTQGVRYSFEATTTDASEPATTAPVHFTGDAYMRNAAAGTMTPCW